ncbi:MAG: bile acid:sodium symporter family protein [Puniceicoccaceae bacterium]
MKVLRQSCLYASALAGLTVLLGLFLQNQTLWNAALLASSVCLSLGLGALEKWKGYQYTAWIVTAVVAGLAYPAAFLSWGEFDLRNPVLVLLVVQAVMFGMGTQMHTTDFKGISRSPRGVFVGLLCQFSIMPVSGLILTKVFSFPAEIAAGIILIGSCSSGLASNVMTYLARANLVLSITVTACATLLAPFCTPFLMKMLAGTLIEIDFLKMMLQIIKIVLVPIGAALLHDFLRHCSSQGRRNVYVLAGFSAAYLVILLAGGAAWIKASFNEQAAASLAILGYFAGAVLFGLLYHGATLLIRRLDSLMPYISMAGIVYFTTVTTAAGREQLLQIGLLLFLASVLHNATGYVLGFWLSRLLGLDQQSARAMALEVGLQNGGMASGIAGSMGKLGTLGLASAVFSPWMNISGSILANYWKNNPPKQESSTTES